MARWMCVWCSLKYAYIVGLEGPVLNLTDNLALNALGLHNVVRQSRLRWFGHVGERIVMIGFQHVDVLETWYRLYIEDFG